MAGVSLRPSRRGMLFGLAAAVSFGMSAPFAKRLLGEIEPQMLAGLLYAGAFVALLGAPRRSKLREARLRRTDGARLAVVIVTGGLVAPVLLLLGLERVSGVTGSLLLTLEGPLTILVGVTYFREHLSRHAALGAGVVFLGALLLGAETSGQGADWLGVVLIAAACACWSIDNNVTQSLTVRDPRTIVTIKAGVAGATNIALALVLGQRLPALAVLAGALGLGALSYGFSVYWDALALRDLGAAREAAVFAVGPFAGALISLVVLPETLGLRDVVAGALMAVGVVVLGTERHEHVHEHEPLDHDHAHTHDEHHRHEHPPGTDPAVRHAHPHLHGALVHAHAHVSDVHHRHAHHHPG